MNILNKDTTIKVLNPYQAIAAFEKGTTRYIYCECTDSTGNFYNGYVKNDYTLSSKLIKNHMTLGGFISRHVNIIDDEIEKIKNIKRTQNA